MLGLQTPDDTESALRVSLEELAQLVGGLGIEVVERVVHKRHPSSVLGAGKLADLCELVGAKTDDPEQEPHADLVIVDAELRPGEAHQLGASLGVQLLDRPGVILEVFERRAKSREAKLEIEIARAIYQTPRVRADSADDGRVGGGGRGGRGNTNVELAKQALRERIAELREELVALQRTSAARRERRMEVPTVALVGYTNAGKSSWMRALTGSEVLVEDKLFATLGTTVRALWPKSSPRVLVSDTVGFIRNLPHSLVASFRATLDEARHAGLLAIVADASDPEMRAHLEVTREVLSEIGASELPWLLVLNKIDRIAEEERASLRDEFPDALLLSSRDPLDVQRLREAVLKFFDEQMVEFELEVPYARLGMLPLVHEKASVLEETYTGSGAELRLRASPALASQLRHWARDGEADQPPYSSS